MMTIVDTAEYTYISDAMSEFKNLSARSKSLLNRATIDKGVSEAAGMPMPHDTGAMGNIMPAKKKGLKLVPKDIEDEKQTLVGGAGIKKMVSMLIALQKLDGAGEEGINAGFGHEERVFDKDGKVISDKDESLYVPEDIENEKGLVHDDVPRVRMKKASYENTTEGGSWTDETSPIDDSFYLPAKIKNENSDTDKKAKKKKEEADEAEHKYFGKVPDNPSDQGKARVKQNYNTGQIENAQIGGQGV